MRPHSISGESLPLNDFTDELSMPLEWESFGMVFENSAATSSIPAADAKPDSEASLDSGSFDNSEEVTKKKPAKRTKRKLDAVTDLDSELQHLRNEMKKMQRIRDRMNLLEQQNCALRNELRQIRKSPMELKRRSEERAAAIRKIFNACNEGNVEVIKETLKEIISHNCSLLTPSLFQQLEGFDAVLSFFTVMSEIFPDGMYRLGDMEVDECGVSVTTFTYEGTKISRLPSDVLYQKWKSMSLVQMYNKTNAGSEQHGDNVLKNALLKLQDSIHGRTVADNDNAPVDETKLIKISGHIIFTYEAERVNRIAYIWNSTSFLGQLLGFSGGELEGLNTGQYLAQEHGLCDQPVDEMTSPIGDKTNMMH